MQQQKNWKEIVVDFSSRKTILHIHYVGLSRVTVIEGLRITDLCESKIAVKADERGKWREIKNICKTQALHIPSI